MPPVIWVDSDVEDADDLIEIVEPPPESPRKKPGTPRALVGPSNIVNTPTPGRTTQAKKRPLPPADEDSDIEIIETTPKISRREEKGKSKAREPSLVDDEDAAVTAALQKQWDVEDTEARTEKRKQTDSEEKSKGKKGKGKLPEDGIVFHVATDADGNTIEGDHDPDNAAHLEEVKRDFEAEAMGMGMGLKVKNVHWFVNAKLETRFEAAKELLRSRGVDVTERNLFHGTAAANIRPILENGFHIPGVTPGAKKVHGSSCGVGVYLATNSTTSIGYAQGATKMFMCRVITGRSTQIVSQARPPPLARSEFESWSLGQGVYVVKYVDLVVPRYVVEFEMPVMPDPYAGVAGLGVAALGAFGGAGLGAFGGAGLGAFGGAGLGAFGGVGLGGVAVGGAGLGAVLPGVAVGGAGVARLAAVGGAAGVAGGAGGPGLAAMYARMAAFALPPPPPIPVAPPIPVFDPLAASASKRAQKPASKRTPAVKTEASGS